jgi:hypothetical protein
MNNLFGKYSYYSSILIFSIFVFDPKLADEFIHIHIRSQLSTFQIYLLGEVGWGWVSLGDVRLGWVRSVEAGWGLVRLGEVGCGWMWLSEVGLGWVRLSEVWLGFLRLCEVRWGWLCYGWVWERWVGLGSNSSSWIKSNICPPILIKSYFKSNTLKSLRWPNFGSNSDLKLK